MLTDLMSTSIKDTDKKGEQTHHHMSRLVDFEFANQNNQMRKETRKKRTPDPRRRVERHKAILGPVYHARDRSMEKCLRGLLSQQMSASRFASEVALTLTLTLTLSAFHRLGLCHLFALLRSNLLSLLTTHVSTNTVCRPLCRPIPAR